MGVKFDLENPAKKFETKNVVVQSYTNENKTKKDQTVTVTVAETDELTNTSEWHWKNAITVEASTQFKAGIPFIADGQIKLGAKDTLDFGKKTTSAEKKIKSLAANITLFAEAGAQTIADVIIKKHEIEVPFTATCEDGTEETGTFNSVQCADVYVKYRDE